TLSRYAPGRELDVLRLSAGDDLADFAAGIESGRMLVFRRYMYAVAERITEREGAVGIVTGEALGQKSSQTVQNLAVTSAATTLPIHRPLLSMDKETIVERAREIGTFRDATMNVGCERVAPDYPETNATVEQVEAAEPDDLLDRAAALADERYVAGDGQPGDDD
ncbi:MAG: tRNA 4-thiouridine(8) synthase ThiI, partial [Halolamina sp.]